jgi:hypothetical protein
MIQFKLVEIVDYVFFKFPSDSVLNGTLSVNTTAIKSTANCEAPQTFALTTPGTSNFTIDASNSAGCSGSVTFDPGKRVSFLILSVPLSFCISRSDVNQHPVRCDGYRKLRIRRRAVPACNVLVFSPTRRWNAARGERVLQSYDRGVQCRRRSGPQQGFTHRSNYTGRCNNPE